MSKPTIVLLPRISTHPKDRPQMVSERGCICLQLIQHIGHVKRSLKAKPVPPFFSWPTSFYVAQSTIIYKLFSEVQFAREERNNLHGCSPQCRTSFSHLQSLMFEEASHEITPCNPCFPQHFWSPRLSCHPEMSDKCITLSRMSIIFIFAFRNPILQRDSSKMWNFIFFEIQYIKRCFIFGKGQLWIKMTMNLRMSPRLSLHIRRDGPHNYLKTSSEVSKSEGFLVLYSSLSKWRLSTQEHLNFAF